MTTMTERTAAADIRCPECGETVWDVAYGHKLHKCWNTEGHKDGGTLAFDTPADADTLTKVLERLNERRPA